MSETNASVGQPLDAEKVEGVSGGLSCSPEDIEKIINGLKQNYETLIDFTSYVMDRVAGNNP